MIFLSTISRCTAPVKPEDDREKVDSTLSCRRKYQSTSMPADRDGAAKFCILDRSRQPTQLASYVDCATDFLMELEPCCGDPSFGGLACAPLLISANIGVHSIVPPARRLSTHAGRLVGAAGENIR